ncbi:unnamed protein product [Clonostachys chloroleuca]|uniref:Fructose-bisphosphate aldolase n=1 Tax=Clonostachys chloroleuca TaxID=1926264 RepID=A0AA35M6S6_9HYPO|nr:unnamed protein product [Clonostachys chloroleuca]
MQLFPWSMHFQGPWFVKYVSQRARAASAPISVHLDHCLKPSDVDLALECAFDSIMVDGSLFEEEENIKYVRSVVDRARAKNITVEAELGRMEGGEDGIPVLELESVLTKPEHAARFVQETGTHYLAPSFGNVHGPYGPGGAENYWQLDRLEKIHQAVGINIPLVLHGTHPLSDELVQESVKHGIVKINQNRNAQGVEIYSQEMERMMVEVFKSANRA